MSIAVVACGPPEGAPFEPTATLRIVDFELVPTARTCPATTPVSFGMPGLPQTYSGVYRFKVVNGTADPVTIQNIKSNGAVIAAKNDVGVGRPAQVITQLLFTPTAAIDGNNEATITAPYTTLCGDNPIIAETAFWDIAISLEVTTDRGALGTETLTFRRNWDPCGPGHPCPATQPPLPGN